jgi:hypothetical protein
MLSAEASTMREAQTTTYLAVWKPVSIVANHCTSSCDLRDPRRLSESSLKNWAAAGRNRLQKLTGNPGALDHLRPWKIQNGCHMAVQ